MNRNSANGLLVMAMNAPFLNALISGLICAVGLWIYFQEDNEIESRKGGPLVARVASGEKGSAAAVRGSAGVRSNSSNRPSESRSIAMNPPWFFQHRSDLSYSCMAALAVSIAVLFWTSSITITLPFTFFSAFVTWKQLRNRRLRAADQMLQVWPEVTDHLISALHSGLSLSEALAGLGTRGPILVRPYFLSFKEELVRTGDFTKATEGLKIHFSSHGSDQILEAILLAKSLGGSELLQIFRTLGDFLRQDLAVRKEIEMKHGWIKNSAHLSSAAPWLLLLLLSSQPGTAKAFNQPSGIFILVTGVFLTALAYLWMGKLSQLPKSPRVFKQVLAQ